LLPSCRYIIEKGIVLGIGELAEAEEETSEAVTNTSNTTNSTTDIITELNTTSFNQSNTSVRIDV
jgi:hypothetical protein